MRAKKKDGYSCDTNLIDRRKVIKSMVTGATMLTALHILPTKWGTPIIEQICLPAHAATSGGASFTLSPIAASIAGSGNLAGDLVLSNYFENNLSSAQSFDVRYINVSRLSVTILSYSTTLNGNGSQSFVRRQVAGVTQVGDTIRLEVQITGTPSSVQTQNTVVVAS